ncbi:MAG TPA: hypothetical protein VFQ39_15645 [Longimicrobium sp.]|nr:hypothetical protein [Longimicrobium sp.]
MRKLRLEELDVASFPTTEGERHDFGTVRAHERTQVECSGKFCTTANTANNCSIDFCTHGCPLPTTGANEE